MIAMPSVSRAAGTTCSVSDIVAIIVGAIAKPATNRATRHHRDASRRTTAAPSPASSRAAPQRTRLERAAAPVDRAGDDAGDQAAGGPQREQEAGVRALLPCSSANATVLTSAAPNSTPRPRRRAPSGITVPPGHRGAGTGRVTRGCGGRLGGALGGEGEGADHARDEGDGEPGHRVPGGGEHGDQDRAEHEDRLVAHRLERERGLQLGRAVESTCDQRARTQEPTAAGPRRATAAKR